MVGRCKGFVTAAEAENKRTGGIRKTDVEEQWRKEQALQENETKCHRPV